MPAWAKRAVIKHTELKDGCVFKSKTLGWLWLRVGQGLSLKDEVELAKSFGGDELGNLPYIEGETIVFEHQPPTQEFISMC
jgi:hypothetical protein